MITAAPATHEASEPIVGNYFVAAYPPFSAWKSEYIPALQDALHEPASPGPLGIYVHIPFCQKKCDYCYYLSYVGESSGAVNKYLDTIARELKLYASQPALRTRRVSFVYFGGGTPSTLSSAQLDQLNDSLRSVLDWGQIEEITFECAPRSVRPEFLKTLREIGVTRISMGVQSFDNALLKLNGRMHLAEDVERAYKLLRNAGFEYVNIDLMAGLIGETPESWRTTVSRALELSPESVTIYQTEIPHNTQLYRDLKSGALPAGPVSWETKRNRLLYGFSELERGGYTIVSAYNAVKDPEIHRFRYQDYLWRGADMLGLGVASFGYFGGVHFQNEVTLKNYEAAVLAGKIPVKRAYRLRDWEQLVREFVLQLKLGEVRTNYFQTKFGADICQTFAAQLDVLSEKGFLVVNRDAIRLTRAGLLRVDRFLPRFYDPEFREIRYT